MKNARESARIIRRSRPACQVARVGDFRRSAGAARHMPSGRRLPNNWRDEPSRDNPRGDQLNVQLSPP
ncbi:MAG: hypothetical protein CFK52_13005 [Chloracidobacterium sp. CP2_5A]|nr:MAG: hypothetical protein CFK52_13005 [Chloracidobacterium sp. CP2_5A]